MQTRIATRETTKRTAKRTGRMGAAMVVTNHVGAQQKRGWGRVEEDEEGLVAEPVALYLEDEDKRALLRAVMIEGTDGVDSDEGAGLCDMTFFPSIFLSDFNCANRQLKLIL